MKRLSYSFSLMMVMILAGVLSITLVDRLSAQTCDPANPACACDPADPESDCCDNSITSCSPACKPHPPATCPIDSRGCTASGDPKPMICCRTKKNVSPGIDGCCQYNNGSGKDCKTSTGAICVPCTGSTRANMAGDCGLPAGEADIQKTCDTNG